MIFRIKALLNRCFFWVSILLFTAFTPNPILSSSLSDAENLEFKEAVKAVKSKNYGLAIQIFEKHASNARHDAQYNLAVLLQAGKGRPRNYQETLFWAWQAQLGGIEEAKDIADDMVSLLPAEVTDKTRDRVQQALQKRVDRGDISAIPQLGLFFVTIPEEKDYLNSYIWYSIGRALDIPETESARDNAEAELEPKDLVEAQTKTLDLFDKFKLHAVNPQNQGNRNEN